MVESARTTLLWDPEDAMDGQGVTDCERRTIQYVCDTFNCTDAAKAEFALLLGIEDATAMEVDETDTASEAAAAAAAKEEAAVAATKADAEAAAKAGADASVANSQVWPSGVAQKSEWVLVASQGREPNGVCAFLNTVILIAYAQGVWASVNSKVPGALVVLIVACLLICSCFSDPLLPRH